MLYKKLILWMIGGVFLLLSIARAQTTPLSDLDALRYIASHSDLIEVFGADPAKGRAHYEEWGVKEGRKITFEPLYYTASHPDLISAFGVDETKAVRHYIETGFKEKRGISFDPFAYLALHADLRAAFGSNLKEAARHYILFGSKEGRVTAGPYPIYQGRPASIRFEDQLGSAVRSLLITNTGTADLLLSAISIEGADTSPFTQTNDCASIKASASCEILVTFKPADFGAKSATLKLVSNAVGSPHIVAISGLVRFISDLESLRYIASHPDLIAAFGTDAAKGRSHYEQYGLKEGRTITFEPLYYIASHPDLMDAFGVDETKAVTHYIQTGFNEKRQTTFTALDALRYIASHPDLIQAFGADGRTGLVHYIQWGFKEGRKITFDPEVYLAIHADVREAVRGNLEEATKHYISVGFKEGRATTGTRGIQVEPAAIAFGSQAVGSVSASQTVSVKNTGSIPLSISAVALSGEAADQFTQTNNCSSVAAGASCAITVVFNPTSTGAKNASKSISHNASSNPTVVTLSGTGAAPGSPAVASDLDALRYIASHADLIAAFGTDAAKGREHYNAWGEKEGRQITFDPLRYIASHADLIGIFGTDELKAVTHYIQWGFKEGRTITFDPAVYLAVHPDLRAAFGTDTKAATRHYIQFGFNEGRSLVGAPAIQVSPSSVDFGNQTVNTTSTTQTITVTNTGSAPLTISRVVFSGPDTNQFSGNQNCTAAGVAIGGTCRINVSFKPTSTGAKTTSVSIEHNASGSPTTISLAGNGLTGSTVPGPPVLSSANPLNQRIRLSFTTPSNGGATISGYRARCSEGTTTVTAQGIASPLTVADLTNGKTYSCSVAAENSVGISEYSNALSATPSGASVSGTVLIDGLLQIDGDTNDPSIPASEIILNGTPETAQILYAPFVLAGHVNAPGAGPTRGRWHTTGDSFDYFFVQLKKDQVITLKVNAQTQAVGDLLLYLYDSAGVLRNQPSEYSRRQTATVPTTGNYWILVRAVSGASKYILDASEIPVPVASAASVDFVTGQGVVTFAGRSPTDGLGTESHSRPTPSVREMITEMAVIRDDGDGDGLALIDQLSVAEALIARDGSELPFGTFPDRQSREKYLTVMGLRMLAAEPGIETAEPNYIYRQQAIPTDPNYVQQAWHYEQIGMPSAWDLTRGSSDVVVAVIDTGVARHPDLSSNLLSGYDFVSSDPFGDGDGRDADATDPGTWEIDRVSGQPLRSVPRNSHGTHVAGTISAMWGNGQLGVGVAPNARILPVRVLDAAGGFGTLVDIAEGIKFAAGLIPGNQPAQRASIINLSLGGGQICPEIYQNAINAARAAGVIVIAASGNENTLVSSPANCNGVVAVGATNRWKQRSYYSNFGSALDVVAPGGAGSGISSEDVYSTDLSRIGDGATEWIGRSIAGTSMAAPHVAGVAALMKGVRPSLTPAEFDQALEGGLLTIDLGPAGWDQEFGRGLISAPKAVSWAQTGSSGEITARIDAAPRSVSVGAATNEFDVLIYLVGNSGGTVFVTPTPKVNWLTILSVQSVDSRTLRYRVAINRALLPDGFHDGGITFSASVGPNVTVAVSTIKRSVNVIGKSGFNYGTLVNSTTRAQSNNVAGMVRGTTSFSFSNVAAGQYFLIFGGDTDGDGFFCGVGEPCGYYGDRETGPVAVSVDGAVTGLSIGMSLIDISGPAQQALSAAAAAETRDSLSQSTKSEGQPLVDPAYDILGIQRNPSSSTQSLISLGVVGGIQLGTSGVGEGSQTPSTTKEATDTTPARTEESPLIEAIPPSSAHTDAVRVDIQGAASQLTADIPSTSITQDGAKYLENEASENLSGSLYRVFRAKPPVNANQLDAWRIEYLTRSGQQIASRHLPDSARVQWRLDDDRSSSLSSNSQLQICNDQVWVVQDGYQLLVSRADLALTELRSAEVSPVPGATVSLISDLTCIVGGGVRITGYLFGVSATEPRLSVDSQAAKSFEVLINRSGEVQQRDIEEVFFLLPEFCSRSDVTFSNVCKTGMSSVSH